LPYAGLQKSWLNGGNFRNAYLMGADLYQTSLREASLRKADLRGADLRFANFSTATLTEAKLTGACYVEGMETQYLPPDVKPKALGMIPIPEDKSYPGEPDFQRCPTVFLNPTP
jgi:Pentapeptide repeats (8 copies)